MRRKNQRGFTLIEVLITVAAISFLISGYYAPRFKSDFDNYMRTVADKTAEEMYRIGVAAQTYSAAFNGTWPDETNDCRNAISLLQNSGYMPSRTLLNAEQGPMYRSTVRTESLPFSLPTGIQRRLGQFYTECPEVPLNSGIRRHIKVSYAFPGGQVRFRGLIQSQVPSSTLLSNTNFHAIVASIPQPAAVPIVDSLLPRDGSRTMTGNLNMDENNIYNAENVVLASGQSLASTFVYSDIISEARAEILKPQCAPNHEASILAVPIEVQDTSGLPITKFRVWADNQGTTKWRIRNELHVAGRPGIQDSPNIKTAVLVRCILKI